MSLRKYWVNRHSMVGEHDSLRTTTDIPMYLACDIDAALREAKAEGQRDMLVRFLTMLLDPTITSEAEQWYMAIALVLKDRKIANQLLEDKT